MVVARARASILLEWLQVLVRMAGVTDAASEKGVMWSFEEGGDGLGE